MAAAAFFAANRQFAGRIPFVSIKFITARKKETRFVTQVLQGLRQAVTWDTAPQTKEETLELLKKTPALHRSYQGLNKDWKERFLDFCIGKKSLPLTYDPFFKYLHYGKTCFDTGLKLELLQEFCLIALDVFREIRKSIQKKRKTAGWDISPAAFLKERQKGPAGPSYVFACFRA